MKQIPEHILLSALFLFFTWGGENVNSGWFASLHCSVFRISESTFRDICHHLHAVISYEVNSLISLDPRIDLTRPYYDQGQWFHPDGSIRHHVWSLHGTFRFYHKSFYDFLWDPIRSGSFCINTPATYCKFLDHFIQCHHHYASSYAIDSSSMYFLSLHLP